MLLTGPQRLILCLQSSRKSPLHVAADKGKVAVIRVLLEHGADANIRSKVMCVRLRQRELASERDRHVESEERRRQRKE